MFVNKPRGDERNENLNHRFSELYDIKIHKWHGRQYLKYF
jgi:hypothetical protein